MNLSFTTHGIDVDDLTEHAWAVAGTFYGERNHSLQHQSDARIVTVDDSSITYRATPTVVAFEADFVFVEGEL